MASANTIEVTDSNFDAEILKSVLQDTDPKSLASEILKSLTYRVGKDASVATPPI